MGFEVRIRPSDALAVAFLGLLLLTVFVFAVTALCPDPVMGLVVALAAGPFVGKGAVKALFKFC